MTMVERFKEFLVSEFRKIAPTKEAMDYRKEVLGNLIDKAQELRIKGMTDEEMIFNACIESLGDFEDTLRDFDSKRVMLKKELYRGKIVSLSAALAAVLIVVVYLVVSFAVPNSWSTSWLILVGGAFAGVIALLSVVIAKAAKKRKYLAIVGLSSPIIVLAFVFGFLVSQLLFHGQNSWFAFLIMVIALLGTDAVLCCVFPVNKIIRTLVLLAAVEVTFALVYVMLGVASIVPWSPYWLLPVVGVAVDFGILIGTAVVSKKKKDAAAGKTKAEYDENYYTNWE